MSRTVYLNGEYLPEENAKISIFDRSALFGDAIYEVAGVVQGKLIDFDNHMNRLDRSLNEINIPNILSRDQILSVFRKLVEINKIDDGLVYMQITRGVAERDFTYAKGLVPTIFMFTQNSGRDENRYIKTGVSVKSVPDIRWARRDIKSVNLLGQVLAKQTAAEAGAYEALLIDTAGFVTECGSTSFYIFKDNSVITRPLSNDILPGVTRRAIVELCETQEIALEQRKFSLEETYQADEAFLTGASTFVLAVTKVDDIVIGTGEPGAAAIALREIYTKHALETAI